MLGASQSDSSGVRINKKLVLSVVLTMTFLGALTACGGGDGPFAKPTEAPTATPTTTATPVP